MASPPIQDSNSNIQQNADSHSLNISLQNESIDSPSSDIISLSENYFSQICHLNRNEVVEKISECKKLILLSESNSSDRKEQVRNLIELRIALQELDDQLEYEMLSPALLQAKGHQFCSYKEYSMLTPVAKLYCDSCSGYIWLFVQACYQCSQCQFVSHVRCLKSLSRYCIAKTVRSSPSFSYDICPEKGLPSQKYKCGECREALCGDVRLCDYTGLYFCSQCHWGNTSPIPARIIHNWDFSDKPISQGTKQFFTLMLRKPVINIDGVNDKLFVVVQELTQVKELRENIILMKQYLVLCRKAAEKKILLMLSERQHFVDNSNMYSLQDLFEIYTGQLITFLQTVTKKFSQHIKSDCPLCKAKAFVCELCDEKEVIYPFDEFTSTCTECLSVFHRHCFSKTATKCPRCLRKQQRILAKTDLNYTDEVQDIHK